MQGLKQPGANTYPLAGTALLTCISLCVSSPTLGRGRDRSSWVWGTKWVQEQFPNEDPKNLFNPFF